MEDDIKYKIGLKSENKNYKNNFISSTLHCLININILSNFIIKLTNDESQKNPLLAKYKELLNNLEDFKKKNNKEPCSIGVFEAFLFSKKEFKEKDKYNPQYLLNYLITEFNFVLSSEFKNTLISDNFYTTIETIKKCQKCDNFIEDKKKDYAFLYFDLHQNILLNNNKEIKYNIYDCLKSYVKTEKNENNINCKYCGKDITPTTKILFQKLPKHLIIYVNYGKDINFKLNDNISIIFDKELDFSKIEKVEENYKKRKYYLSSLISIKEIMREKEYFYTFCISKEKNKPKYKYFCYNADDVHEVNSIENNVDNIKINFSDKKERFPSILIYTNLVE